MGIKFLLSVFLLFIITGYAFSQSDFGPGSKTNVSRLNGITDAEKPYEQSRTADVIPQNLFTQLEQARRNNNEVDVTKIQNEIDKYSTGQVKIPNRPVFNATVTPPPINPPFTPDWMGTDILIRGGKISGYYSSNGNRRTVDLKSGKDGILYMAVATDSTTADTKYIYFFRSTNSGLTWSGVGGIQSANTFSSLSISVDRKGDLNDSTRISCYYTAGTDANGADAGVYLFSFRPRAWNDDYRFHTLGTPTTGRKFGYVTTCSDGAYYSSAVYIGCVVGEYSNNGDSCVSMQYFRTTNWGLAHTGVTLNGVYTGNWGDFYPSASLKRTQSVYNDSVYIAVERRFSATSYGIRLFATPWSPSVNTVINYLTSDAVLHRRPILTVRQTANATPRQMIITYTKSNICVYSASTNDGTSWQLDGSLDPHSSTNGFFTYCSSDTLTSTGCFVASFRTSTDSLSVRRGYIGSLSSGTIQYKLNSASVVTGTIPPVCAIYRSGTQQLADVSYVGTGPSNCWFDAENLPTNIGNNGSVANEYALYQNYPNPFNPSTTVKFSIIKPEFVRLTVYDIMGKEVLVLVNKQISAGNYSVDFDGSKLSSGIYFYKISAGDYTNVKKMMLIK
jgi:hypothetical protein